MRTKWSKWLAHAGIAIGVAMLVWARGAAAATLQVGPGETYETIQAAIDAAQSGDTIQVAAGTYEVSAAVSVNKPLTIRGAGVGQTIVQTSGAASDPVNVISVSADQVTLQDMTIKQRKTSNTSVEAAVVVSGSYPWDNSLDGFRLDACRLETMEFGIVVRGANWTIANSELAYVGSLGNNHRLIGVYGNAGTSFVSNNTFECSVETARTVFMYLTSSDGTERYAGVLNVIGNTQTSGDLKQFYSQDELRGTGLTLNARNNTFNAGNADFVLYGATPLDYFTAITLVGNHASNAGGKGLLGLDGGGPLGGAGSTALILSGNVLDNPAITKDGWAEATGSAGGLVGYNTAVFSDPNVTLPPAVLSVPGDYTTIQAAINAASNGDTIQVAAGTYNETLTLGKSLTLIGSGPSDNPTTVITASSSPMISLTVAGKSFVFQNLIVEGTGANIGIRANAAIDIQSLILRDVIARNCKVAVYMAENYAGGAFQSAVIENLLFERVTFADNSHIGAYIGKAVASGTVTDSTFSNNGFADADPAAWQKTGLQFVDFYGGFAPRVVVSGCAFVNNGTGASTIERTGLSFYTATDQKGDEDLLTVSDSSFTGHPQYAVRIKNGCHVGNTAIVNGTFSDNYLDIWFNGVIGQSSTATLVRQTLAGIRTVGVGPTYDYNTIQAAIDAASNGDTIRIAAGTYGLAGMGGPVWEPVSITKSLTLSGAGAGVTILDATGFTGHCDVIGVRASQVTVRGITINRGSFGIRVPGFNSGLNISDLAIESVVVTNVDGSGLVFDGAGTVSDVTITDSAFIQNGNRGIYIVPGKSASLFTLANTRCDGNQVMGFNVQGAMNTLIINGGSFNNNVGGSPRNTAEGPFYGFGIGLENTVNATINDVTALGNGTAGPAEGGAGIVVKEASSGVMINRATLQGNTIGLWLEPLWGPTPPQGVSIQSSVIAGNLDYGVKNDIATLTVNGALNYWGAADGPAGAGSGSGDAVSANVTYAPWYADAAMTQLQYAPSTPVSFTANTAVGEGETISVPDVLTVGTVEEPVTVTVNGGTLNVGTLNLAEGSVLEVINGTLVLGEGEDAHTITGTFTIYNSFGSVYIENDTEFDGATLALISDIHVAPGVKLTVSGALTLDGCVVNSMVPGSPFAIAVTESGAFAMTRTELTDATVTLGGNASELRDNTLANVDITVSVGAVSNRVYHNVFASAVTLDDDGTATVTEVDGWGNVGTMEETLNNLTVSLTAENLEATRTLDNGNLYIQPGDVVRIHLEVGALSRKISGVEAMLGFSTDFFTPEGASALGGVEPWLYELHELFGADGVYGKLDAGIGLDVEFPDPVGTTDAGTVAQIDLESQADAVDGVTKFYFRARQANDNPQAVTRLSGFDGLENYALAPFTRNSGAITVDGTAPEVADLTAAQDQGGEAWADLFASEAVTRQGEVVFTVDAFDALAGIVDEGVALTLTHADDAEVTIAATLMGTEALESGWTRYTFAATVTAETPNGVYEAALTVRDRSGNASETLTGAFEVRKNQLTVTVALQGAVADAFSREVTFVATDANGNALATWVRTILFTAGVGTDTLLDAPAGMAGLSAKTDFHLRRRLAVALDGDGQGVAAFTGTGEAGKQLLGGDLNADNVVNMDDYNRLRYYWYTVNTAADITGSGVSNLDDLNVLKANWYGIGDPL